MKSLQDIPPAEMALYRATARRRHEREMEELRQRQATAWRLARQAATLLTAQFGATRVVLFGSLAREGHFTRWSDVDIAAWGLRPLDTFRAIGAVMDLGGEIEVNLADVNTCSPSLLAAIEREGIEL
jgi:predicted nucleotidyltransferase